MVVGPSKILFLGTVAVSAGGVVAGNFLISSSEKKRDSEKTLTSNVINQGNQGSSASEISESQTEPKNKKCLIFVAGEVSGSNQSITFTKILEKFESVEEFLKGKQVSDGFKDDVKKACSGLKEEVDKTKETFNVYVYQKNGTTWNYTKFMQRRDWINDQTIINNSGKILQS